MSKRGLQNFRRGLDSRTHDGTPLVPRRRAVLEEEPAPKGVLVVVPKFMSHDRGWRAPDAEETIDRAHGPSQGAQHRSCARGGEGQRVRAPTHAPPRAAEAVVGRVLQAGPHGHVGAFRRQLAEAALQQSFALGRGHPVRQFRVVFEDERPGREPWTGRDALQEEQVRTQEAGLARRRFQGDDPLDEVLPSEAGEEVFHVSFARDLSLQVDAEDSLDVSQPLRRRGPRTQRGKKHHPEKKRRKTDQARGYGEDLHL